MFNTIEDSYGNRLYSLEKKKYRKLVLKLKSEQFARNIGQFKGGELLFNRDPDFHCHHKTNSYGFNEELLRQFPIETVVIIKEKGYKVKLKTTIKEIFEKGQYLFFLSKGFERQIFLSKKLFDLKI